MLSDWRDEQILIPPPGLYLIQNPGDLRIVRRQEYVFTPDLGRFDAKTLSKPAHHVLRLLPICSASDRPNRWNLHATDRTRAPL